MEASTGHASLLGNTFAGYRVLGLIGRGAMGAVYLAQDLSLKRPVALKVLLGSLARNPIMVKSFQREAQAAAPLRHPNIVRIYNAGVEHGTPYIAMEYIEGEPLDRFLRRKGRMPWQTALFVGEQVANALACAHENGIIHRDVKPGNILLDKDGRIRLTDFGIANIQAKGAAPGSSDRSFIGTPHYMSPEQCSGKSLTPASDLFSLGVMLYRLISGRLPFDAESPMELIQKIRSVDPPRLNRLSPEVTDDVARLVAHMMQKRPEARPASAEAVQEAIQRLISEQGGRSALPAALSAFIREEAEVRTVRRVDGGDGVAGLRETGRRAPWVFKFKYAHEIIAGTCILAALLAGGTIAFSLRKPVPAMAAPVITTPAPVQMGDGAQLFSLPAQGFHIADLEWLGESSVILAALEGSPKTLNAGAHGLMALNAVTKTIRSVRPPVGPLSAPGIWDRVAAAPAVYRVPAMPAGAPLAGAIPIAAKEGRNQGGTVYLRRQDWDVSRPEEQVLAELAADSWVSGLWGSLESTSPHIAMSPDGRTICMVVYDDDGSNRLVERDVTWPAKTRYSRPITAAGSLIDPKSVQYAPDGRRIGYMRMSDDGRRELWVVDPAMGRMNGALLALGHIEPDFAFAPDGVHVLLAQRARGDATPMLRVVRISDGTVAAEWGIGVPAKSPWHPEGAFGLVHAPDAAGIERLAAVEARAPYRRFWLGPVELPVKHGAVISADGRQAAMAIDGPNAAILVLGLETVNFGGSIQPAEGSV
jgi:predicted Ser/Thr protein kinase